MNIRYFSYFYFLSLYLLNKEIQRDTYLNPCSKFILNFLDLFTLKSLHFVNDRSYLNSNLCLSDYALFSNHNCGYADLSKRLWLCMSKCADTHLTPLCMQTRLISHFTNSSDISTYQILYRRQIRTCPNDLIVLPSRLRTGERIADSAQLRFHPLSLSI
jgi:hypothetical protein